MVFSLNLGFMYLFCALIVFISLSLVSFLPDFLQLLTHQALFTRNKNDIYIMFDKNKALISTVIFISFIAYQGEINRLLKPNRRLLVEETHEDADEHLENYPPSHPKFWLSLLAATGLIMLAAICSGMTVGYLSIDELQLEIKLVQGTIDEKRQANVILPIIRQHHMLLCTLLITNALCMEALPIFFDKIVPPAFAILISVIFIVFGGEILPQAICTGPNQLAIAERLTPVIKWLMVLTYPCTYPLASYLDKLFGQHGSTRFHKSELKALIELHDMKSGFTQAEVNMITSTIDLREKSVVSVMIPLKQIVMINSSTVLNTTVLEKISNSNYSYIGIYEKDKHNIVGTIKTKDLIDAEKQYGKKIGQLSMVKPSLIVSADANLMDLLMIFKSKKTKIAFIEDKQAEKDNQQSKANAQSKIVEARSSHKVIGLVSLKDIFEEVVKKELQDQDNHVPYYSVQMGNSQFMFGTQQEAVEQQEK